MTEEGMIPVGSGDLPIDVEPLDESQVYTGEFRKAAIAPKTDKSGNVFCAIQVVLTEGDFEGRTVMCQWLPLPQPIPENATKRERIAIMAAGVPFERFCRSFGIKSAMPSVRLSDPVSLSTWHEWISQFYGNNGKFTVQNQEFPENSGRVRSGINDFVF